MKIKLFAFLILSPIIALANISVNTAVTVGGGSSADGSQRQGPIKLFILAGQSNAYGAGGSAGSAPAVPKGAVQWTSSGGVAPLALTAGTSGGETFGTSIVPQFAVTYYTLTGQGAAYVVGSAIDGSAQAAGAEGAGGNFDTTGSLRGTVVSRYNSAKAALESAGYTVVPGGILWLQGEQDAEKIRDTTITKATYKTALQTMIAYYRTNIASDLPFLIVRTGIRTSVADTGSNQVRAAQEEVAYADPKTWIVYRETINFSDLGYMADTVHYNQSGLNNIGLLSAIAVAGNSPAVQQGSGLIVDLAADNQTVYVGTQSYIRLRSDTGTASSRTVVLTQPSYLGQRVTFENVTSGQGWEILDGGSVAYGAGVYFMNSNFSTTAQKATITFTSDGVNWVETSRSAN